ncbi:BTAD domain-containing putative transcriptional regulator [Nonomuraea sp. NPDC050556]|uniref:AfsR/SARP family transcriptional regulator n=1 Tax=Nonomuraea sp. NPDC050556 TaxID=3364369 RepID=UPI0037955663
MEFRVLGRLGAGRDGRPIELTSPKQRALLAVLLAAGGRAVSDDQLTQALWGEFPPASANLRWHVHHVRQALGDADRILRLPDGYALDLEAEELDARRFEAAAAEGAQALAAGRHEEAARALGRGLALWHGPAYADLPELDLVRPEALRLEELRLTAFEQRAEALLALRRAKECLTELTAMVTAHPLRERLREHLMRALQQAGRRADALRVYREGREILTTELGIEPGRTLRDLHTEVLRDDGSAAAVRPAQLPPDVFAFTGRSAELDQLDGLLDSGAHLPIAVVSGVGGVGKTGLAVHWAHRVAARFPDGQLYADLGGREPGEVLERFMSALGVMRIPDGLEERTALYRSLLRGRRILVLLDNATGADQVRPLLPGSASCCVVVTGRRSFEGLIAGEGARPIQLDVLGVEQAAELLERVAGVAAGQAGRLAELCDGLPLALRISGARLLTRPGWTPDSLADRLAQERLRLDELRAGELDVRATFEVSYRDLPERERLLFSRLGQLDVPGFTAWTAAALMDGSLADGAVLLERLAEAQLLQPLGPDQAGQERYGFHDLVKLFARQRAADEGREAALTRFFACLLALAQDACLREYQGGYALPQGDAPRWWPDGEVLPPDPLGWLDAERATLVAAVSQTAALGLTGPCWELAHTATRIFEVKGYLSDWRSTAGLALEMCRRDGDTVGTAATLVSMSLLYIRTDRFAEAREVLKEALPAVEGPFRSIALCALGDVERVEGDLDVALVLYEEAKELSRLAGDKAMEAMVMADMATVHERRGNYATAEGVLAWAATHAAGIRRPLTWIVMLLARLHHRRGDYARAEELHVRVMTMVTEIDDRMFEPLALSMRAENLIDLGRVAEARQCLAAAVRLASATANRRLEQQARDLLARLPGDA